VAERPKSKHLRGGLAGGPSAPPQPEFLEELDRVSRSIGDPSARLRYIRESLARAGNLEQRIRAVPGSPFRRLLYRWLNLEELTRRSGRPGWSIDPRVARSLRAVRATLLTVATSLVAATAGIVTTAFQFGSRLPPVAAAPEAARSGPASLAPDAAPPAPSGIVPEAVWLVERGHEYELYSNGLRVDLSQETDAPPRRFRTFDAQGHAETEVHSRPVGILFHTTESDVWPLEESYNDNLKDSTQRLLRYLRRERVYNYLIDRFGRVYRVVREDAKANHAGHSVWSDAGRLYLSLNHSFLGVSFETRWEGGQALPITEAQLTSGRRLTDLLRQRYGIAPGMCTTHGLTSVNPEKRLIGHHLDWSRGFPFRAFGLPDQYLRSSPAVATFGFGYDERLLEVLGEPWAGVRSAERGLEAEARRLGRPLEEVRKGRQSMYDMWRSLELRDEQVAREGGLLPQPGSRSGG
jgi:hypothetical protein